MECAKVIVIPFTCLQRRRELETTNFNALGFTGHGRHRKGRKDKQGQPVLPVHLHDPFAPHEHALRKGDRRLRGSVHHDELVWGRVWSCRITGRLPHEFYFTRIDLRPKTFGDNSNFAFIKYSECKTSATVQSGAVTNGIGGFLILKLQIDLLPADK